MSKALISIVIPVLNEEDNIRPLYSTLIDALEPICDRYNFEFVFTDNHSKDRTFAVLHELSLMDHRVRVFRFSQNVGFQRSILSGYLQARGDAVVQVDCDLQDPPSLILSFVELCEQGYHVVYGIRRRRIEGWWIRQARSAFYWIVDKLSESPLPRQAGDFRLVTRPVIEAIREMDDAFPYLRGTIASLGFNQIGIPYDRDERKRGESKFPLSKLVALAVDGILATSIVPLRMAVFLGLTVSSFAVVGIFYYFVAALFFGSTWPSGFATIAILLSLSLGMNSLFLGVIGEYVGRIYVQSKRRPLSSIEYSIENGALKNHARRLGAQDDELSIPSFSER